jgi:hypothetical protein
MHVRVCSCVRACILVCVCVCVCVCVLYRLLCIVRCVWFCFCEIGTTRVTVYSTLFVRCTLSRGQQARFTFSSLSRSRSRANRSTPLHPLTPHTQADLGAAGELTNTLDFRKTAVGTPYWMAPELVSEQKATIAVGTHCTPSLSQSISISLSLSISLKQSISLYLASCIAISATYIDSSSYIYLALSNNVHSPFVLLDPVVRFFVFV